jgi:7,8-didemethyl-8-hydroxy-5-deazariboflavin synthase CofG subunit
VLGNGGLALGKNVDTEALACGKVGVGLSLVIDANQHQLRLQRDRGKGVGSHAVHAAAVIHGDDSDTGGERRHGLPKLFLSCTHEYGSARDNSVSENLLEFYHEACVFRPGLASDMIWFYLVAESTTLAAEALVGSNPGKLCELSDARLFSREDACAWIRCSDDHVPQLLARAQALRDRFKPGVITYSRKVFIPLTNLCRDYCGYCTFRRDPGQPGAHTMTPDEVLTVAKAGERLGCTEALFSLGDKPEMLFPEMRETLRKLGYNSTLHYLEGMCDLVLRETSLLPHPNPGLMSAEWISRLSAVSPSMGLMLETTNESLLAPGAAHHNAPDKLPSKRLRTIEEAGKQGVPFTTGILIGIGESPEDRVDALLAIRDLHERYEHIQEVIIQNFRAKPGIPMHAWPEPSRGEMLRTIAVARLLMPEMNIQSPPNLSNPDYEELLDGGINDWGGISPLTPDFINPERPWPHLDELATRTTRKGFELRQRLPVYPEFLPQLSTAREPLASRLRASADPNGLARSAA